ncbi:hypothetical protein HHL17_16735 [Chitinophaga sp. G-6-1-13]|uniref:Secreted protein n=1 Tax=Chitinophaga fulva TaxID=2728842 RepID=A0A848GJS1_9BACT|nr:hypothetical protein [Chitinophaga fulva]NML38855.1 hypothetical protein [Chitinophaga fulva]
MKKIKIFFATLMAMAGVGGAYAAAHRGAGNWVNTIYRWHTISGSVIFTTTVSSAQLLGNCTGGANVCLRGTGGTFPNIRVLTLFHR